MTSPSKLVDTFRSTRPPWVGTLSSRLWHDVHVVLSAASGIRVLEVKGANCRTKRELLREFASKLNFPGYFGHNWDALHDCLRDLEWIPADGYAIVIDEMEKILDGSDKDYATFVEILEHAGKDWAMLRHGWPAKPFHVLFVASSDSTPHRRWPDPY